jgi:hypothetical protein
MKQRYLEPNRVEDVLLADRRKGKGNMRLGFWPRRENKRSTNTHLPLHAKNVPALDWEKADQLVADECPELLHVWNRLTNLWRDAKRWEGAPAQTRESEDISLEDLEELCRKGILIEIPFDEVRGTANSFSVDETEKGRRRWISLSCC